MARLRHLGVEVELSTELTDRMHAGIADRLLSRSVGPEHVDVKPEELRSAVFTLAMTGGSLREVARHLQKGQEDAAQALALCVGSVLARQQGDMSRLEPSAREAVARFAVEHNVSGFMYAKTLREAAPAGAPEGAWAEPLVAAAVHEIEEARALVRLEKGTLGAAGATASVAMETQRIENAYAKLANVIDSAWEWEADEIQTMIREKGGDDLAEEVERVRTAHDLPTRMFDGVDPSLGEPTPEAKVELYARMTAHTLGGEPDMEREGRGAWDKRVLAADVADKVLALSGQLERDTRELGARTGHVAALAGEIADLRRQVEERRHHLDGTSSTVSSAVEAHRAAEARRSDAEAMARLAGKWTAWMPGGLQKAVKAPFLKALHVAELQAEETGRKVASVRVGVTDERLVEMERRLVDLDKEIARGKQDIDRLKSHIAARHERIDCLSHSGEAQMRANLHGPTREAALNSLAGALGILHQSGGMFGEDIANRIGEIGRNVQEAMRDPTRSYFKIVAGVRSLEGRVRELTGVDLSEAVYIARNWKRALHMADLDEAQVQHWSAYGNTLRPESGREGTGSQD